jgi:hypothetical protein
MSDGSLEKLILDVKESLERGVHSFRDEVIGRLDRIDATLTNHGKLIAAGTRTIAGFTEWTSKADADYACLLAELAALTKRVDELEKRNGGGKT